MRTIKLYTGEEALSVAAGDVLSVGDRTDPDARIAELEAELEKMRRERDDLRDILAGIGANATRAAQSYRENIKT